jgi:hypothetical protein
LRFIFIRGAENIVSDADSPFELIIYRSLEFVRYSSGKFSCVRYLENFARFGFRPKMSCLRESEKIWK